MTRSFGLVCMLAALAALGNGPAQAQLGDDALAKSLTEVPKALEGPFARAIAAWQSFSEADERLAKAFADELAQLDARAPTPMPTPGRIWPILANDDLNRYLYPWSRRTYGNGVILKEQAPVAEAVAAATEAKAKLRPGLAREFIVALDRWREFRARACTLVTLSRGHSGGLDGACADDFSQKLAVAAKVHIDRITRAEAGLRSDLPRVATAGAKLHYVEIYSAQSRLRPDRQKVDVVVSDRSAPLILVLRAHEPIEWVFKLDKGVRVRQIILYGIYRPTSRAPPGIPVRAYSPEEGNSDLIWGRYFTGAQNSRLDLSDALTDMIGIPATTMQFRDCPNDVCTIDGRRSWKYQPVSRVSGEPIVWMIDGKPSPEGARVTNSEPAGQVIRASEARSTGRWYFEVTAEPLQPSHAAWAGGTVGVFDASRVDNDYDLLYRIGIGAGKNPRTVAPGSTVSVALDLDNGNVSYAVNGTWVSGNPVGGEEGKRLTKGRDYFPGLVFGSAGNVAHARKLSPSQVDPGTWTGRFAAGEFLFPIPPGYLPYETGKQR